MAWREQSTPRRKPQSSRQAGNPKAAPIAQHAPQLLRNIRNGARAAFFRHVEPRSWAVSAEQLILLTLVVTGVGIVLNRTFYSGSVAFNWSSVRILWAEVPVYLLVGWLTVRFASRRVNVLFVPVALLAMGLTMDLFLVGALHLAQQLPERGKVWTWFGLYYGQFVWVVAVATVLVRRTARPVARRVFLAVLPIIVLSAYSILVPPQRIWYQKPANDTSAAKLPAEDSPVSEEFLYLQPRLAQKAVAALRPHESGAANLYFIGFAPYADQDVFKNEAESIRTLMDERFNTRWRSLLLINNNKTLRRYPLATVTNLRAALRHVGRLMNRNSDVLVVYLTSHGSPRHHLVSDYWPLQLTELDPVSLKHLLDEAGIKWRVIIVSACYSGGFIEPLRGPTTLVMTAADATHTSFGCSAHGDYTYFAKALFDEQLRKTHSFEAAFQGALPVIQAREKSEGDEFSNPQMAEGDAIHAKLAQVARELDAAPSAQRISKIPGDGLPVSQRTESYE